MTEVWTYYAANVIQIEGDVTSKYWVGSLIYITQASADKFFIITAVSVVSGNTRVTVNGGGTYTLTNDAITSHFINRGAIAPNLPLNFQHQANIVAATAKTALADSDNLQITDSAANHITKKVTWASVKSSSKTYFDTLYSLTTHNHDAAYSAIGHNHTGVYSLIGHDHNSVYSLLTHDHNSSYAALSHTHTGVYSPVSHNHDTAYAALSHTHSLRYAAQYSMGTGQSIAPSTYVDLVFPTEVFDTDDAVITNGSSPYPPWRFVAPVGGAYRISGMVVFQSCAWTAGGHISIKLYKNGSAVQFIGIVDIFAAATMTIAVPFDGIVFLSANDYIHIGLRHPSASTLSLANAGTTNRITISRL